MHTLLSVALSLGIAYLFSFIAKKLNLSVVIGLICAGLFVGAEPMKNLILGTNIDLIDQLGEIGLLSLMFIAGLEVSWHEMYAESRDSVLVAFSASLTPMILGLVVMLLLGFPFSTALIVGICLSITSEATNARVLLEMKKLKTRIGSLIVGAGIFDDMIGMILFLIIAYQAQGIFEKEEFILLLATLISFLLGIMTHKLIGRYTKGIVYLEKNLLIFVIPFFFISMGIHFSFESLWFDPLLLLIIVATAIIGKIMGVALTKPITKLDLKQIFLVGWAMNSRGAIELAIAFIAYKTGLINNDLYSSLIIMALITTLFFTFFFRRIIKKTPGIMK